jgi:DNA recombination protein RmuC
MDRPQTPAIPPALAEALDWLARPLAADPADPRLWVLAALATWLIWRAAARAAALAATTRSLAEGQERLTGALGQIAEAQARLGQVMDRRLAEVQTQMGESLSGSASRTAHALGALQERLAAIDRAQAKIERLSGDVLSLQDILSNKQARGAFGEIQLADIVQKALPPDAYVMQATLSNGRRVDCLLLLPDPPGPTAIDAKFPLEAYEQLRAAEGPKAKAEAQRQFRTAVRAHIAAIAERYLIPGETADGALMFLPSEAVYAELHANFADVVREGFAARVWIVSPTTLMATLNTMRAILRDSRLRAQAGAMRRELGLLHKDIARLLERVAKLDSHFEQARRDVEQITISAEKASARAARLETADLGETEAEARPRLTVLGGE